MTETHGRLEDEGANCAVDPVVHIGAADTGELDGDLDIAIVLNLGDGTLFVCYVVWLVEDEGEVLRSVSVRCGVRHGGESSRRFLVERTL